MSFEELNKSLDGDGEIFKPSDIIEESSDGNDYVNDEEIQNFKNDLLN